MVTTTKQTIGSINCLCCEREIPARMNNKGTVDLSCWHCGFTAYAKADTEALVDHIMPLVTLKGDREPPDRSTKPAASGVPVALSNENATDTPPAPAPVKPLSFIDILNGGRK